MSILVTGGLGYIGSHTCVELLNNNYSVVVADNLSNSSIEVKNYIEDLGGAKIKFYEIDVTDSVKVNQIFEENKIEGVIHFAGYKAVGESVENPLKYYYNNILSTITVSKACVDHHVRKMVFSSSATVYGDNISPLNEEMDLKPTTNPYGETKAICERILSDLAYVTPEFSVTLLRYFNPVGAHESGLIGENPNGTPNNLMPFITRVATGSLKILSVYGDDYDTSDGTGVRDYIHVVDLADGHVKALEKVTKGVDIYNLGTGKGTSVLELVEAFKRINCVEVPYRIVDRRNGDIAICFAETRKAEKELDWKATRNVEDMVRDSWRFESAKSIK